MALTEQTSLLNIDPIAAIVFMLIGMAIASPITILLDKRSLRARESAEQRQRRVIELESKLESQQSQNQTELEKTLEHLKNNFSELANSALKHNNETFLTLAKSELGAKQSAITDVVKPLKEQLTEYNNAVNKLEGERKNAYLELEKNLNSFGETSKNLQMETTRLVQALRNPKTSGQWGEFQLQNLLEHAGMTEHFDFVQQQTFQSSDGQKRPDVIVKLPSNNCIVIDAKTPITSYLDGIEEFDEQKVADFHTKLAKQLRQAVKELADANYQRVVPNTIDYVVMFVPIESFFSIAVRADASLIDDAIKQKVMIATPMLLLGLLKVIALGWQQEKLARHAYEVAQIGRQLHERIATYTNHIDDHRKALDKTIQSYNKSVSSLQKRVLPSARKLESLDVVPPQSKIASPEKIDRELETTQPPE